MPECSGTLNQVISNDRLTKFVLTKGILSTLMNLNSLELNPEIISELYKNHLVDLGKVEVEVEFEDKDEGWDYIGENKKNILLLVDHSGKTMPAQQFSFLKNLITACGLDLSDIALVNRNKYPGATINSLLEFFRSNTVLLFGIEPQAMDLPINFPLFQVQTFNSITYLYIPAIDELTDDKILKSKVWVCLKRIFNL